METTFTKAAITLDAAWNMIAAAQARARELGMAVSIAIVDESGVLKAYSRMDGAPLISVNAALKKAITAVGYGMKTGEDWYAFVKDDPILLHGVQSFEHFTMLGGGVPVYVDGALIAGVGVSGGHYANDEECARAAVDSLAP